MVWNNWFPHPKKPRETKRNQTIHRVSAICRISCAAYLILKDKIYWLVSPFCFGFPGFSYLWALFEFFFYFYYFIKKIGETRETILCYHILREHFDAKNRKKTLIWSGIIGFPIQRNQEKPKHSSCFRYFSYFF